MTEPLDRGDDGAVLQQVFEDLPVPIAILDEDGRLRRCNDAYAAFLSAFGRAAGLLDEGPGVALPEDQRVALARVLTGQPSEQLMELPSRAAAGEAGDALVAFQHMLVPSFGPDGRVSAIVRVLIDVTDERSAERDRARFQERMLAAQKLESLGLLAGGVAHDFNNLLMSVLGHADLLGKALPVDSVLRRHVSAIEIAAKRASEIAGQMLTYAGRGALQRHDLDLSELVRETAELLRVTIPRGATFELDLSRELPDVHADATQLRQVVLNLITNAAEAQGEAPGVIRLTTAGVARDRVDATHAVVPLPAGVEQFVLVEVRDQGRGMDEATVRRIFDPFFTTKVTGRGLGLSAVLGIVRSHRGAMTVESTPGVGTIMRVLLPAGERRSGLHPVLPKAAAAAPGAEPKPRRVLVVDEEPAVREVTRALLGELGFAADDVSGGQAALDACSRVSYDLVLLDVHMPGLDGRDTATRLRALHPALPIVLMSGAAVPLHPSERFVYKPFDLAGLRAALQ